MCIWQRPVNHVRIAATVRIHKQAPEMALPFYLIETNSVVVARSTFCYETGYSIAASPP